MTNGSKGNHNHTESGYTTVAILQKPYGLKGEVKAQPMSFDFLRYKTLKKIFLFSPETQERIPMRISHASHRKDSWFFTFDGIHTPEEVAKYRLWEVQVPDEERAPLPDGLYYFCDLPGLTAVNEAGETLGTLVEAREGAAHDLLYFRIQGKDVIAPWIDECIGEINLQAKTIVLHIDYLKSIYDL